MDLSDKPALAAALYAIGRSVGISLPADLLGRYLRGELRGVLLSDKLLGSTPNIHPLRRYMLACHAYLKQPDVGLFYDIYAASRAVPIIRIFDEALGILPSSTPGLAAKLNNISTVHSLQDLDAGLFEIICGARYAHELDASVEFVEERASPSPDILCRTARSDLAVEAKKYNKYNDIAREVREHAWNLVSPVVSSFQESNESVLLDIVLHSYPEDVSGNTLSELARRSLKTGGRAVATADLSVQVQRLPDFERGDLLLFPSPSLLFTRYGYEINGAWHGIIPMMRATWAGPSFLNEIGWDSAARWRIASPEILWRHRKLNYKLMRKGISQLQGWGDCRILHVAIERDPALGPRPEVLAEFVDALGHPNGSRPLDWVVFNEFLAFPTVRGHFDFQEHAHWVGLGNAEPNPPVSATFIADGEQSLDSERWGVGADLPEL